MDTTTQTVTIKTAELHSQIRALSLDPSDKLVTKVLEIHALRVPESTIRKAWRELDKERQQQKKNEKEAAKAAKNAQPAPPPAVAA